ncbi:MAG: TMEM175 family protein [Actinobacteria bacterium]|nr:TMEM175 family protein [Actinomycetota bacterium]
MEKPTPPEQNRVESLAPVLLRQSEGTGRLEAFSDGVFAIAITLLILNFHIPTGLNEDQVWNAITDQQDVFLSAAISFVVIGVYWTVNRKIFALIDRTNGALTASNFIHLATIVFLPFPTLVMSEYTNSFAAVGMYAATIALAGFTAAATVVIAWRGNLMDPTVTQEMIDKTVSSSVATPIVFAASIPIAAINTRVATWFWFGAFFVSRPVGVLAQRILQRRHHNEPL